MRKPSYNYWLASRDHSQAIEDPTMPVFISHSHEDEALYSPLSSWLDNAKIPRWDVGSLARGSSLANQLRAAIEKCEVCVFLATRTSLQSSWCRAELGAFWGAGKPVIIYLADSQLRETELPPQFLGNLCAKNIQQLFDGLQAAFKPTRVLGDAFIVRDIEGLNADSPLFCVTFKPNKSSELFAQSWILDKEFKVPTSLGKLVLEKAMIRDHLEDLAYPYKFCLLIDIRQKNKYINYLLNGNCTITGKGEQDSEDLQKWRIWFLVDREPIHPYAKSATLLNHTLMPA